MRMTKTGKMAALPLKSLLQVFYSGFREALWHVTVLPLVLNRRIFRRETYDVVIFSLNGRALGTLLHDALVVPVDFFVLYSL